LRCVVPLGVGRRGMKVVMGCDRNEWREKLRKKSKRGTWDGGTILCFAGSGFSLLVVL
jgi:hypothetical protein